MNQKIIVNKMEKAIDQGIIPGISIAFLNNEQTTTYYLGKQGIEPFNKEINADMQYDLASLSKVVGTTTRILQLIDEKKISLDTQANELINCVNACTIKELLLHCAGYPSDVENKYECTKETLIEKVLNTPKTIKETQYSDIGYIILGLVIEAVDQMKLEESFQHHIFKPLGMLNTSYFPNCVEMCIPTEKNDKRGMIQGVAHDHKGYLLGQGGSAGLFSTLNDLVIFCHAYLNQSSLLFSKEIFELLNIEKEKRTLGWDKKYGEHILYHTGFTGTSILLNLEKQEGMILLTNRIHPTREDKGYLALREQCNQLFLTQ